MEKNKNLTPFKLCVLQNFPFIEEDFDALTNYGLMCKIVEYLNKVIEQQNITGTNVNTLINWFNNLDVQDEINKKLDEMAQDGTLAQIIEDYATIPELTARIDDLELNQKTEKTEMVVIGDSYSSRSYLQSPNKLWCEIVSERLGLNLHNYADPGAGFVADGDERQSTFITQLDEAKNDNSFNNNKVAYVFIYGGVNDLMYTPNVTNKNIFTTEYSNAFIKARTNFPKAKIIYLGCDSFQNLNTKTMSDSEQISPLWIDYNTKNNADFIVNNIISIDLTLFYIGMSNFFTDGYAGHPNAQAHQEFANAVINGMFSSSNAFVHLVSTQSEVDSSSTSAWSISTTLTNVNVSQLRITDKTIKIFIGTCLNKNAESSDVLIKLPFGLRIPYSSRDNSKYIPGNFGAYAITFSNNHNVDNLIGQDNVLIETEFGYDRLKMYTSWIHPTANFYDLYITHELDL